MDLTMVWRVKEEWWHCHRSSYMQPNHQSEFLSTDFGRDLSFQFSSIREAHTCPRISESSHCWELKSPTVVNLQELTRFVDDCVGLRPQAATKKYVSDFQRHDEVQKGAVFAIETMASRTQTVKRWKIALTKFRWAR
jgi:hypothetical protein